MIEIYFNLESRLLLKLISIIWIKSIWDLWFFGIPTIGLQAKMAAWIILIIANDHSFSNGPTNDNRKFLIYSWSKIISHLCVVTWWAPMIGWWTLDTIESNVGVHILSVVFFFFPLFYFERKEKSNNLMSHKNSNIVC